MTDVIETSRYAKLIQEAAADGIQQLVVGAVVHRDALVLILKRPETDFMGGIWELPSGKVEGHETLDQALTREVHEETGLTVADIRSYLGCFDYRSGSGKPSRQFNFAVDVIAPEPMKLTEHDAYAWTPVTPELPVTEAVKTVLDVWAEARTADTQDREAHGSSRAPRP